MISYAKLIVKKIMARRTHTAHALSGNPAAYGFGLTPELISSAIDYVYTILDSIDENLLEGADLRLSEMVELANLSAIIGNLFRTGIVRGSYGKFKPNAPHTYPDLLGNGRTSTDIEIKVALENNKPKGHLVKPGPHITLRYVLADEEGKYVRGKMSRGTVPWIWDVRVGMLDEDHFNFSNTAGDSGKTAVINAAGMQALLPAYFDANRCPVVRTENILKLHTY